MTDILRRKHYLDWLRILSMGGILLLHSSHFFDDGSSWDLKNEETGFGFTAFMGLLHFWVVPLFFFVSGAACFYSLKQREAVQYLGERMQRLGVPLLFSLFFLVLPMKYFLSIKLDGFQGNIFVFASYFFSQIDYRFTPLVFGEAGAHLWFLFDLLIFSILGLPVFLYLTSRKTGISFFKLLIKNPMGIYLLIIPLILTQVIFRPLAPGYENWADFFFWFEIYIFGYFFATSRILARRILKNRHINLAAVLTGYITMGIIQKYGDARTCFFESGFSFYCSLFNFFSAFLTWMLILAVSGYGIRYLSFTSKTKEFLNESTLPVYLIHRPIVIFLGYYVISLRIGILPKFLIILSGLLIIVYLSYRIIKKTPLTRFIFGMRD